MRSSFLCLVCLLALMPSQAGAIAAKQTSKKTTKPSYTARFKSVVHRITHPLARRPSRRQYVVAVSPELRVAALNKATANISFRDPQFENSAALVPFFELLSEAQRSSQAVHI